MIYPDRIGFTPTLYTFRPCQLTPTDYADYVEPTPRSQRF